MTTNDLDTIQMTRQIRDALYEQIRDKSTAERLAFYTTLANTVHDSFAIKTVKRPLREQAVTTAYSREDQQ